MNLRDLQYLVAVANHGHFGRAAAACYVSRPTLSTQIKKLERELGVELVERSTRGAVLTPAGQEIVRSARAIPVEFDGIHTIAKRAADPEAATLRVGLFHTLAPYLLPHVVPAIHNRFPKLELLLSEEKPETVLDRIRDGALDAGVLALPIRDDGLVVAPLFDEDFVLVVPSDHPFADTADEPVGGNDPPAGASAAGASAALTRRRRPPLRRTGAIAPRRALLEALVRAQGAPFEAGRHIIRSCVSDRSLPVTPIDDERSDEDRDGAPDPPGHAVSRLRRSRCGSKRCQLFVEPTSFVPSVRVVTHDGRDVARRSLARPAGEAE